MQANSAAVESAQQAPHTRLAQVLQRHLATVWQRPIPAHALAAFEQVREWLARAPQQPLWLDSGCGTGASSRTLSRAHPDVRVLGADRSRVRLQAGGLRGGDFVAFEAQLALVRIPLEDLWRLLVAQGISLQRHLLLYPNPYPKAAQLRSRWHAHPAFPALLALGGEIELRSNWLVYVQEFALALRCTGAGARIEELTAGEEAITPFERKYRDSGHRRWRLLSP